MKERLQDIEERIQAACKRAGRNRSEVTLIAVSKTKPASMVKEAYQLGLRHFGENKVQELNMKLEELSDSFDEAVHWHLIGHLQRNKVRQVIDKTDLIHSVDSLRLGQMIEEEAGKKGLISDILIEVNVAQEDTKYGVPIEEVIPLITEFSKLKHIRIRGLMTIAPYVENAENNRIHFKKLHDLFIDIQSKNIDNDLKGNFDHFDILSMGMTGDFEVAIEEGATMIRVGTGLFGERDYTKSN